MAAAWLAAAALPIAAKEVGKPSEKAAQMGPRKLLSGFDANKNGRIDGPEVEKLREAYAGALREELARFDLDGDGRLDDREVAGIRVRPGNHRPVRGAGAAPGEAPVK